MNRKPLDPAMTLEQQIQEGPATPVVLVNLFLIEPDDEAQFLSAWAVDAGFMKTQPGFISAQLHRAVGASPAYLNTAIWQSTGHFRDAFSHPGFRATMAAYPASGTAMPHLFEKVAIDGICVS